MMQATCYRSGRTVIESGSNSQPSGKGGGGDLFLPVRASDPLLGSQWSDRHHADYAGNQAQPQSVVDTFMDSHWHLIYGVTRGVVLKPRFFKLRGDRHIQKFRSRAGRTSSFRNTASNVDTGSR